MERQLRILHLEDSPNDSELVRLMLEEKGIASEITRVESNSDFKSALERHAYDLIISDFTLPSFDGLSALAIAREKSPDTPFLFVSATIGEEAAIESLRQGATDYVLKQRMSRLVPAVIRALREAEERKERERAEKSLKESELRYREVVENAAEIIFSTNERGNFISANPAALKVSEFSLEELKKLNFLDLILPEHRERVSRIYKRQFLDRHKSSYAEYPFHAKSGMLKWFAQNASPRTVEGRIVGFDIIARDITERKIAEEALARSESELRSLFAAMIDVVLVLDAEGRYLQIAPTNPSPLYKPPAELIGKTIHEVLPPGAADNILKVIRFALEQNKPIHTEYNLPIGGDLIWFDATISPMGKDKVIWIDRDITSRKKTEEELALQRSYFEQLFADSPYGIVLLDPAEHVISANRAFEKIFQNTFEEIKGCTLSDFIAPEDKRDEARSVTQRSLRGELVQLESVRKRKDNSSVHVAITAYPITIKREIVGMYRIFVDITERKKLEQQLSQAQKLEGIGTLAGGIAHDFNNILGIILAYTTILENLIKNPEKLIGAVEAITKAVQRGSDLVRQLLTFARQTEIRPQPMSLNAVVEEITKMLRATFPKTIEFSLQLDKALPPLNADQTELHQVLLNLCINARDAMANKGRIILRTERVKGAELRSKSPDATEEHYVHLVVTDTGSGMDQEMLGRIFDPFFTTKEAGKGTGLGLAVVYGVVKSHKGFVDVESKLGKGTSFHLYFPVGMAEPVTQKPAKKSLEEEPGGNETILLVEDETSLRTMVQSVLEAKGYKVLIAVDGVEAVGTYKSHTDEIDLVVTDMGLPKLGGWQAALKMKEIKKDVRIILASGFVEPKMKGIMEQEGFVHFIQKPYNMNEILERIRDVLNMHG